MLKAECSMPKQMQNAYLTELCKQLIQMILTSVNESLLKRQSDPSFEYVLEFKRMNLRRIYVTKHLFNQYCICFCALYKLNCQIPNVSC